MPRSVRSLVVTVLLLGAAAGAARAQGAEAAILPEPIAIGRGIDFATRVMGGDGARNGEGWFVEFAHLPTGSGWPSAGPGYRRWMRDDRVVIETSAALSWRAYKMAQGGIELPRLLRSRVTAGAQARWQDLTQITYFGDGPDTPAADRSEYRLESVDIVGYASVRPARWASIGGRVGRLSHVSLQRPAGPFQRGYPAAQDVFASSPVFAVPEQPGFTYGELSIESDTRDHRSHPTRGGLYRAAWSSYRDGSTGAFSFDRAETEAAHFVPLDGGRIVLALHGWLATSRTPAADGVVPFYLEPSLGGHNTVRAYSDFRFHDHNLLLVNAESRVALFAHIDAAVFADAGSVASRVSGLTLDRRAFGVGLRLHSARATLGRLDVAHGSEGWRVTLRLNDALGLSRLSQRTAPIPFVP